MRKADEERIALIVATAIRDHDKELAEQAAAAHRTRHIKRRVTLVTGISLVVVLTHHFTHVEPIGKLGEVALGALYSWFLEKSARGPGGGHE